MLVYNRPYKAGNLGRCWMRVLCASTNRVSWPWVYNQTICGYLWPQEACKQALRALYGFIGLYTRMYVYIPYYKKYRAFIVLVIASNDRKQAKKKSLHKIFYIYVYKEKARF